MPATTPLPFAQVNADDFTLRDGDDELRVDTLCCRLLLAVRDSLLAGGDISPRQVGAICRGADLFLRDFVIAACGDNLLRLPPERVRQFAGHWYIVNSLEPNGDELAAILAGIAACYKVLAGRSLVTGALAEAVIAACADLPWYRQRIEDYWTIAGDGYQHWRDACPLPPEPRW